MSSNEKLVLTLLLNTFIADNVCIKLNLKQHLESSLLQNRWQNQ